MDFSKILNQVFSVAQESAKNTMNGNMTSDKVAKISGGAAAIGILSMIFGRNGGANLAKLGSLAAIGSLAYQAYQKYRQNQTQAIPLSEENFALMEQNAQTSSQVVLQAMIAAAVSDGMISEEERQAILGEAGQDFEVQQWIEQAINQPATVQQIAAQVGNNPALATQVYLAARVVCADLARKEVVFLAALAEALGLDDALVEQLEQQAGF